MNGCVVDCRSIKNDYWIMQFCGKKEEELFKVIIN